MSRIGGLPAPEASAAAGIRRATDRLARSAGEIARTSLSHHDPVSISDDARRAAFDAGDLAQAFIGLGVARREVAANVAVIRTTDETSRDVLDIVRARR